jgi:hypothetical protein
VTFGPEFTGTGSLPLSTLRTRDVNGDGFPEILASGGGGLDVFTVSPTTLQMTVATSVNFPAPSCRSTSSRGGSGIPRTMTWW